MSTVLIIVIGIVVIIAIPILLITATGGLIQTEHPLPEPTTTRRRSPKEG